MLDSIMAAAVQAHLQTCAGCLEYVAQIRGTVGVLGEVPTERISERARTSLVEAFREWSRQPPDPV